MIVNNLFETTQLWMNTSNLYGIYWDPEMYTIDVDWELVWELLGDSRYSAKKVRDIWFNLNSIVLSVVYGGGSVLLPIEYGISYKLDIDSSNIRKLYKIDNDYLCRFIKEYIRQGYLDYKNVKEEDKIWFMSMVLGE